MKLSSKRGEYLSLTAVILSVVFFMVCWLVGSYSNVVAAKFLAWQILGGSIIWLFLILFFRNVSLADQEKLDLAMLENSSSGDTIFQGSNERKALYTVAQNRLQFFEKWFTPIFAIAVGLYNLIFAVVFFKSIDTSIDLEVRSPLVASCLLIVVAFFSFLISRYATGLSGEKVWKPLKAGGSYMLASALLAFALGIALALRFFQIQIVITAMAWVVASVMAVYGGEALLNQLLDVYRPRVKGQYHRPAFDSRILAIFNEPGGILHTAAHTLDYQFGFQVSQTWFYRLLEKAILPLIIFSALSLYALSCFVVVEPGQKGIIEHLGSHTKGGRIVGPGIHVKLPSPFEIAYVYNTQRIEQIDIGFDETEKVNGVSKKPLLWGQKHYEYEHKLLVATQVASDENSAAPVSIVIAAVPVQYRVKDIEKFAYSHSDPKKTLEDICYRELVRYAASAKIETDSFGDENVDVMHSILGAGRGGAAQTLAKRIQEKADQANLGIDIVMVGLQGLHPPLEVANDYEDVIGKVQDRQAKILDAIAEKNKTLTLLGGDISKVNELYSMVEQYQDKKDQMSSKEKDDIIAKIDKAFTSASGSIFKELSEAKSYAYERESIAKATGERFSSQVQAYRAAPEIYKQQQRLKMLEESLTNVRKYVVVTGDNDSEVITIDLQEALAPSLYDVDVPQGDN